MNAMSLMNKMSLPAVVLAMIVTAGCGNPELLQCQQQQEQLTAEHIQLEKNIKMERLAGTQLRDELMSTIEEIGEIRIKMARQKSDAILTYRIMHKGDNHVWI